MIKLIYIDVCFIRRPFTYWINSLYLFDLFATKQGAVLPLVLQKVIFFHPSMNTRNGYIHIHNNYLLF